MGSASPPIHPEGARYANYASGERRGTGMSLFSVGGNTGFALAPILVTPAVLAFGLEGTALVAILPALIAVALAFELPHLRARSAAAAQAVADGAADRSDDDWDAFTRLTVVVSIRSIIYFGLQSFAAVWLIHEYAASEGERQRRARRHARRGRDRDADRRAAGRPDRPPARAGRLDRRPDPAAAGLRVRARRAASPALFLAGVGFVTVMSFSVSVVMGQEYLPSRLGIASGVTLGLAIGMGGIAAALLGVLADHYGPGDRDLGDRRRCRWSSLAVALTLPLTAHERTRGSRHRL